MKGRVGVSDEGKEGKEGKEGESPSHPLFSLHSHRLRICLLLALALYVGSANRMSLSVGIVCMVNSSHTPSSNNSIAISSCSRRVEEKADSLALEGDLPWTPSEQSLLLSSSFYGTFLTVAFSGWLADRFGPRRVLCVALSSSAILTLLVPLLARSSYSSLLVSRILIGVGESFLVPSINCMATAWFPTSEKTTLAAFYTSGLQLAAGFGSLLAAQLCRSESLGGWQSIFYIFGGTTAAFLVVWIVFSSDSPHHSRWTGTREKEYLHEHLPPRKERPSLHSMPWRALLLSTPLHSILICSFAFGFSTSTMQAYLPSYLKEALALPVETIGSYTLAPFVAQMAMKSFVGPFTDWTVNKGWLSLTMATKVAQSIGSFGASLCLLLFAFVPSCAVYAGGVCGFFTSLLTIAPRYTGTLSSMSQIASMLAACTASSLVTSLTSMATPLKWPIVFGTAALFQTIAGVHYLYFGSTAKQPWSEGEILPTKNNIELS